MKLNATSMGKLFDLMLMGMKYQIISTTTPDEIYHVTMTHLTEMAKLVKGSPAEVLINDCTTQFKSLSQQFRAYDYQIVK
jgi:hypothetical protein